jgi:hypothetical protein
MRFIIEWGKEVGPSSKLLQVLYIRFKRIIMTIEKKSDLDVLIRLDNPGQFDQLQRAIDYLEYVELTKNSIATEEDVEKLANAVNGAWRDSRKSTPSL